MLIPRASGFNIKEGGVKGLKPLGKLKNYILRTPYRNAAHYFEKFNNYAALAAQSMHGAGQKI